MPRTGRPRHDRNRICPKCGKHFVAKDLRTTHCSRSCAYTTRGSHPSKDCVACGEQFTVPDNYSTAQWTAQQCCSRKCSASLRTRLVLSCDHCGDEFHGRDRGLAHVFCCMACYGAWQRANAGFDPCANGFFSKASKRLLLERAGHRCQTCGAADELEFDHVIPEAAGGLGVVDNGQVLCKTCHLDKTRADRRLIRDVMRAYYQSR